jgi:hypothetical protein
MHQAFQAGLKFMSVKSHYELHTGKGKPPSPIWHYVCKVKESNPSWSNNEITCEAAIQYKAATGDGSFLTEKKQASLIAHFREMT